MTAIDPLELRLQLLAIKLQVDALIMRLDSYVEAEEESGPSPSLPTKVPIPTFGQQKQTQEE